MEKLKGRRDGVYEHYWLCLLSACCSLCLGLCSLIFLKNGGRTYVYTTLLGFLFMYFGILTEGITVKTEYAGMGATLVSHTQITLIVLLFISTIAALVILLSRKGKSLRFLSWLIFFCNELCFSWANPFASREKSMLSFMYVVSWIMSVVTFAFWLINGVDQWAFRRARKAVERNRRRVANGDAAPLKVVPYPGERTRTFRLILCSISLGIVASSDIVLLLVDLINRVDVLTVIGVSFFWLIVIEAAILLPHIACLLAVAFLDRRKDWFVLEIELFFTWFGTLFSIYALASMADALAIRTDSLVGQIVEVVAFIAVNVPVIYLFAEFFTRKWEYMADYLPESSGETEKE